jgi:hypothetical protein
MYNIYRQHSAVASQKTLLITSPKRTSHPATALHLDKVVKILYNKKIMKSVVGNSDKSNFKGLVNQFPLRIPAHFLF